jgi:hypothetical protein
MHAEHDEPCPSADLQAVTITMSRAAARLVQDLTSRELSRLEKQAEAALQDSRTTGNGEHLAEALLREAQAVLMSEADFSLFMDASLSEEETDTSA